MSGLEAEPQASLSTWGVISPLSGMRCGNSVSERHPTESKEATDTDRALVANRSLSYCLLASHRVHVNPGSHNGP